MKDNISQISAEPDASVPENLVPDVSVRTFRCADVLVDGRFDTGHFDARVFWGIAGCCLADLAFLRSNHISQRPL